MRARFRDSEFADPMFKLVSLTQTTSVEDYYEEFECLLYLLNISNEYSFSVFVSNLKADISRSVRLFQPKTHTHALNLAKQMESVMYNVPQKPFTPYKTQPTQPPSYSNNPPQAKPHTSVPPNQLPGLLPIPKSFTPNKNYHKPAYPTNSKPPYTKPENPQPKPIKSPIREEKDERMRRRLCMWCS